MAATLAQLFNFLVFCASLVILLNNIMEFRYRLSFFEYFEHNIDLLNDLLIMATAFGATFFSMSSPYDEETPELSFFGTESFSMVQYLIFLLVTSTSVPTDDPQILFRSTYEAIVVSTNGTVVSENVNIYQLEGEELITNIGVWYIQAVNWSKAFLFISALIYALRVVWNNKPDLGKGTRQNFREYILGRTFLFIMVGTATFFWATNVVKINNITIRSAVTNAEELLEDYGVGGLDAWLVTPLVKVAWTYMVTLCLLVVATYIGIFYENFQFGLVCVLVVLIKMLIRADDLLIDDFSFDAVLALTVATTVGFIGTGINWMIERWQEGVVFGRILPNVVYKTGCILSILSLIFLVTAFTYDWMDFQFKPAGLALEVAQKMDAVEDRIEGILEDVFSVARVLDPCLRKTIPSDVTYDGTNVLAAGDAASVAEQMRLARQDIKNNVASADSQCILSAPNFLVDTGFSPRCAALSAELDSQESSLVSAQNEANNLNKPYTPAEEDNEFFVDQSCRETQCTVLLSAGIAAMAISFIPFCGGIGFAAGTAARAGNVIYRIGQKIARFAPKIRRKKVKIVKLANRIRKLSTTTRGKTHFTLKLSIVFLPVIIGATVTACLLMFRREIYKKDNKEGAYERVRQIDVEGDFTLKSFRLIEKLNRGLSMVLGIYLPLTLVNTVFYITLVVMPEVFNLLFDQLPQVLVSVEMETQVGYTSLKLAYLVAAVGNVLIVASNLLYLFDNSVLAMIFLLWNRTKNIWRRFKKLYDESAMRRQKLAEKRLIEFNEETDTVATAADSRLWTATRNIRGWSRWVRIRLLNLLDVLGNWKSLYFQPLFFSLPSLYLVYRGIFSSDRYFVIKYLANSDTMQANDEISEAVAQEDRSEAINQDMNNGLCGLVGQLAESLLDATGGGMAAIAGALEEFTNLLTDGLAAAKDFIGELGDLVDFPSISITLPDIPGLPEVLANFGIYGIPFICSMLLLAMWIAALFVDKLGAFAGMLNRLNRAVKGGDDTTIVVSEESNQYQVASSVAIFILYASLTNIVLHTVIGNLVQTLNGFPIPFISLDVDFGPDYWYTQLASLLNLMSAISLYLNILLPINE
jgi:hypothetical protein